MVYRRKLDLDMEELKPDLSILRKASEELKNSIKFRKLLQTVLAIGNTLNASTFRGGAAGFSLDSLLKVRLPSPAGVLPADASFRSS
jgi:diaphanous 1